MKGLPRATTKSPLFDQSMASTLETQIAWVPNGTTIAPLHHSMPPRCAAWTTTEHSRIFSERALGGFAKLSQGFLPSYRATEIGANRFSRGSRLLQPDTWLRSPHAAPRPKGPLGHTAAGRVLGTGPHLHGLPRTGASKRSTLTSRFRDGRRRSHKRNRIDANKKTTGARTPDGAAPPESRSSEAPRGKESAHIHAT